MKPVSGVILCSENVYLYFYMSYSPHADMLNINNNG